MTREALTALPSIPQDSDGPIFQEPWEAQAFAMAVALHAKGLFTWTEWAEALSQEIKQSEAGSCDTDGSDYYHSWLTALERLVIHKKATTAEQLDSLYHAWDRAARATPHGMPIDLANDTGEPHRTA